VAGVDLGLAGYTQSQGRAFQRRALEAVQELPGVQSAAFSNSVPLSIDQSSSSVFPERPSPDRRPLGSVFVYQVSPGFFQTMGTRLVEGRDLTWHDDGHAPHAAVVNMTFARELLRTSRPIGLRFRWGPSSVPVTVVGVVEDGKYQTLTESPAAAAFVPTAQWYNSTTTLEARSALPPDRMAAEIRDAVHRLDPTLPVYGAGSLRETIALTFVPSRVAAIALSAFGVLALVLTATGLHGVVSYAVARRAREIGIRMAIGASRTQVLRVVLARMLTLLAIGAAAGAALAVLSGRLLSAIVLDASPREPFVFGAVAFGLVVLGAVSCWAPAMRALKVSPVAALRVE
jgi:predicted permease